MAELCAPTRNGRDGNQKLVPVLFAVLVVFALAACGSAGGSEVAEPDDAATASSASDRTEGDAPEGDAEKTDPVVEGDSAPVGVNTLPPQPVGEPTSFGNGLTATVLDIDLVDVEAMGPGDTAGPGVAISIDLVNDSAEPIDLISVSVNVTDADGVPATPARDGWDGHQGILDPGETRNGVYTFRLDGERTDLSIDIYHGTSGNIVVVHS